MLLMLLTVVLVSGVLCALDLITIYDLEWTGVMFIAQ